MLSFKQAVIKHKHSDSWQVDHVEVGNGTPVVVSLGVGYSWG